MRGITKAGAAGFVGAVVASLLVLGGGSASADPSADDWYQLRMCESTNRYDINTGNGYYGAYQFDLPTWRSVGGSGYPNQASPAEQDQRALALYRQRGWSPWVCAALVGLSEDGDARSGVAPPVAGNQGASGAAEDTGAPAAASDGPAWPGRQFHPGDSSEDLKAWQRQMGARGYGLTGTGFFGPNTEAAVRKLQQEAGLNVVGYIGPKTWAAAWSTSASAPAPAAPTATAYVPASNESCGIGTGAAPAWPGEQYVRGDTDRNLQCFQRALAARGYALSGTGFYGSATESAVVDFQRSRGINPSGIIGPKTWEAAWVG
ncbi:peptidoglycan-binding protein [Nakamurella leprariae]|uniref:Peptidoglycan-binding protein n=1 Tax=Nakamurella leprariae TaxID=2803911 RepID=A0A939C195_9ACTN|nr:peptidoglycan-binding protein [Nakamurella leprariae]MBM9469571.1 peptidoglycan-binding protein [Nakamurella leprariae]